MQSLDDLDGFEKRAKAIRLGPKQLARDAGVAPSTVWRIAAGKHDGNVSTFRKLLVALEAAELETAMHLLQLPHVRAALAERARSEVA